VLIGGNCHIFDSDFHSLNFEKRMTSPDPDVQKAGVEIKDGAFIGGGTYILKGVVIGKQSVVAARSVVTKSVPDQEIWGGNPAKFIKKL
jgi:acetyltransferase-like isoleucine patch superfamily enzyme